MKAAALFLLEKLSAPFKQDFPCLIILWGIILLPHCYNQISRGDYVYCIYIALLFYLASYLIVFIADLLRPIRTFILSIIFTAATIVCVLNMFCLITYGSLLSNKLVNVLAETNLDEAMEFFSAFITWKHWLIFILFIIACVAFFHFIITKKAKKKKSKLLLGSSLFCLSLTATLYNPQAYREYIQNGGEWITKFEGRIDLTQHLANAIISSTDSIHPKYVVLILGESFSRNHCSLYDYKKRTNPLLTDLMKKGNLIAFDHITSPTTHTTTTFRYLLNTYLIGDEQKTKWYESTTLIEVFKKAGYYTRWISNQNEKGIYDNVPSGHSKLCDQSLFLEKDNKGKKYDEGLLSVNTNNNTDSSQFIIYHLMGQHEAFQQRYPKEYDIFKSNDYQNCPESQRKTLAAYDNATLYNDFIVYSIINKYQKEDAIIFYLPDHGIELYDTDPDYFGHATASPQSISHCQEIPFMIFYSQQYKDHSSIKVEQMKKSLHYNYCADKLIYTIMDAAGYKFAHNNDVEKYSLFGLRP